MEEKKELGKGVYKNKDKQIGLFMGGFPEKLAREWEGDCKENFGGCRWMKAYADHCKARALEMSEIATEAMSHEEEEVPISKEDGEQIPTIGRKEETEEKKK